MACVIIAGTFVSTAEVDLGDVIFAIAPDVGQHWKSLIDLLGMEARKDVQKIQHECTKTQDGSSSLAQVMLSDVHMCMAQPYLSDGWYVVVLRCGHSIVIDSIGSIIHGWWG